MNAEAKFQQIVKSVEAEEDEAVACLLSGVPPSGGSASREIYEKLVRMAFRGGAVAMKEKLRKD